MLTNSTQSDEQPTILRLAMGKVLGIVYRAISTHLIRKAGFSLREGATGAVTLIQRFGPLAFHSVSPARWFTP
jgi:hypothetical protein